MTQANALYKLQQIDLALLKAQKRLDDITALLTDNATVNTAQRTVDNAAQALVPLRAKARDLDLESQSARQKSTETEQQLYSGSVKAPKAMQEMQQEIEALQKRLTELDDRQMTFLMQIEEAQGVLDAAQAALDRATADWHASHADLLTEQAMLSAQIVELLPQRQAALKPITPESIKTYNMLKPRKAHQPMALLKGISCGVCGIEQTMNIVYDVQHHEMLTPCTNCGRILVDNMRG
ncbi:MAG: hypothetical protein H7Y11_07780 [Armatimonadetes bacterium]|nr:hypothetical protein [Anaerolineae bacterium]